MTGAEWNVIIGIGGLIMTAGLVSVLYHFGVFKYPKKWNEELSKHYVPEILRTKEKEESTNEERNNDNQQ